MEKFVKLVGSLAKSLLVWVWFVTPLWAGEELSGAFKTWAVEAGLGPAALVALTPGGTVLSEAGAGLGVDVPRPLASVSKTLAGHCVMHLVDQGLVDLEDPLSELLDWPMPVGAVRVSHLLTHASGFDRDRTQGDIFRRFERGAEAVEQLVRSRKDRGLERTGQYAYNNENFLVLEAAMHRVLGSAPGPWCLNNVPALTALPSVRISKDLPALGFAGGFDASARDVARFFHGLEKADSWPLLPMDERSSYGPGVIVQQKETRENLFHAGNLCPLFGPAFGAFGARLVNGASVGVVFSGCARDEDWARLNAMVLKYLR